MTFPHPAHPDHRKWVDQLDQYDTVIFVSGDSNDSLDGPRKIQFIEQVDDNLYHVCFTDGTDIQCRPEELHHPDDKEHFSVTRYRLTATFDIAENGVTQAAQTEMLRSVMQYAMDRGLITGDTPAEVEVAHQVWVEIMPDYLPTPDEINMARLDELASEIVEDPGAWSYTEIAQEIMARDPAFASQALAWAMKHHLPAITFSD